MRLWVIIMNITIHDTRQPVKCLSVTTTTLGDGNEGKDALATQVLKGVLWHPRPASVIALTAFSLCKLVR